MSDHPSLPEDKEKKWRKEFREATREKSRKSNSRVQHAANAK